MENFFKLFIHPKNMEDNELSIKSRLFFYICVLSILFTSIVLFNQDLFTKYIIIEMYYVIGISLVNIILLRFYGNLKFLGNFYSFNSWATFNFLIMMSGGVMSSAFQWLIVSILPAYIFTPMRNGHFWFVINLLSALFIVYLSHNAVIGLTSEVSDMELTVNSAFGVGLIAFVPIMVIFYSRANESIKSSLKQANFDLLEQEKIAKQSEEKFRVIAESFPNGSISIIDSNLIVRNAFGEIIKKNYDLVQTHLNRPIYEVLGKDEFDKRKFAYEEALNGNSCSFESEYLGEYYFNSVSPLIESDGSINKFMVASQIITDLKKAERDVQQNQYLLRKIIDTAPIFISRIDKNGRYLIINKKLSKALDIDCEDAVGKHYSELIPTDLIKTFGQQLEIVKIEGKIEKTVEMTNKFTKLPIFNHYIMSAIKTEKGDFDGVVVVGIDVTKQKETEQNLRQKNNQINESIQYATRIQNGVLGDQHHLKNLFSNSFIYFQPKDILSGDFYWCAELNHKKIVIAGDCTGHGVPGALMTIIGINFINEIVYTYGMTNADMILYQLDRKVTDTLINKNSKDKIQDGMDMSVLVFDTEKNQATFAGAKNPVFISRKNGNCERIRGTKYPIGSTHYGNHKYFQPNTIELEKGDMLYIYSDGFQDQMGGHNGKKYMAKNFRRYLEMISTLNVSKQEKLLERSFNEWKSNRDQTDDVLVIGIRYT